jgi:hypothetical protein
MLTDRDEFAKAAMTGLLAGDAVGLRNNGKFLEDHVALCAYEIAEAMLRVRVQPTKQPPATPMPGTGTPMTP